MVAPLCAQIDRRNPGVGREGLLLRRPTGWKARLVNSMLWAMYGRSRTSWFGLTMKPPTYHDTTVRPDVDHDGRRDGGEQGSAAGAGRMAL